MRNISHRAVSDRFIRFPRRARPGKKFAAIRELTLEEMLDDPIVQTLMRRDGVKREEVERLAHGTTR